MYSFVYADGKLTLSLEPLLNAYVCVYLYRNEVRVVDTGYSKCESFEFDASNEGYYRAQVFKKVDGSVVDRFFTNPLFVYEKIEKIDVLDTTVSAFKIKMHNYELDCLFKESNEKRLFVLLTAAIQRDKQQLPVFNRWTWAFQDKFPGSVLMISDATLNEVDNLNLAWYLGNRGKSLCEDIVELVSLKSSSLQLKSDDVIFLGSSGGGFAAVKLANMLEGCKAVAINSQVNILDYEIKRSVDFALSSCFPGKAVGELNHELDLKKLWSGKSKLLLAQNRLDYHHYEQHFLPFTAFLDENGFAYKDYIFSDSRGHVGESLDDLQNILNVALDL